MLSVAVASVDEVCRILFLATLSPANTTFLAKEGGWVFRREASLHYLVGSVVVVWKLDLVPGRRRMDKGSWQR